MIKYIEHLGHIDMAAVVFISEPSIHDVVGKRYSYSFEIIYANGLRQHNFYGHDDPLPTALTLEQVEALYKELLDAWYQTKIYKGPT